VHALLDLLLPPRCPGCGREGELLCGPCARPLARRLAEPPGIPIGLDAPLPPGLIHLEWCARFGGPVRDALHALKYRGERRLAGPLGAALAARWRAAGIAVDLVIPAPVHAARRRERGYDQAAELARELGRGIGRPAAELLERTTQTLALHDQGREARASTLVGAFRIREGAASRVAGARILLVDDIVTTGATLSGCAGVLLDAGAAAVAAIAVAREM